MTRTIIWLNIILVITNGLIGTLTLYGLFQDRDIFPLILGAGSIMVILFSLFIRWKDLFIYRAIGFVFVVLSSIWVVHAHFNIYSAGIETHSRAKSLSILESRIAPDLHHILRINGDMDSTFALQMVNNKFLIINFWATWCPPCIKEMPLLDKFNEEFKDRGVRLIGFTDFKSSDDQVKTQKEIDKIKNLVVKLGISYTILIDNSPNVRLAYGAEVLPATVLVDHEGKVIDYQIGIDGAEKIMNAVRKVIVR